MQFSDFTSPVANCTTNSADHISPGAGCLATARFSSEPTPLPILEQHPSGGSNQLNQLRIYLNIK